VSHEVNLRLATLSAKRLEWISQGRARSTAAGSPYGFPIDSFPMDKEHPTQLEGPGRPLPPGLALAGAVTAISLAGPLVRFSGAPALAIATWRLLFSVGVVGLFLILRGSFLAGARMAARDWALGALAGVLLAGHFWAWVASIQFTTIANSAVLVSMQPLFVAGLSVAFLGERPARRQWVGILIAISGATVIGFGAVGLGGRALLGDALALLAGVMAAGYFTIGRNLRKKLDLWAYTGLVYGVTAGVLLVAVVFSPDVPLTGYPRQDWLVFLGLAAGPMMLGHTGINYALRYLPAYVANLASLGEPVGATLIAWVLPAIHEVPSPQTLLGGGLILFGIALGTLGFAGETETDAS
jgi:drug/metabolite transporter (DMT)-like permease